ncbi:hypothetical protein FIBSPDRAFT_955310 [Athelia psychrophila]|uniref:Uncharacterized protein n=1 Tax=Athelia psychrophila TaxID=1759441 RepID=A0A166IBW3_9AGAM|nr:hypothetical protein FIBSPDRAFT_955310 [Fibularhizoctonia sp. CBS 109695]
MAISEVPFTPRKSCVGTSRSPKKKTIGAAAAPRPTAAALDTSSLLTAEQWFHSKNTTRTYANYVKAGKKFLARWADVGRETVEEETQGGSLPEYTNAFDIIGEHTPIALQMLTAFKCDYEEKRFATAEGLCSSFKSYFERVHGCQGDYWCFNALQNCWEGNPVFEAEYSVYYESLKNRSRQTDILTQALPMLPSDLAVIMGWLDSSKCSEEMSEMKHLYFKAFVTTAFALCARNEEIINLQAHHVRINQVSPAGGGAQYRFMWAKRKWSLKAVKWWGGWSSSDDVGIIMCYLLDELMACEQGFNDILMQDRAVDP